jgi:hypothetical protein
VREGKNKEGNKERKKERKRNTLVNVTRHRVIPF